MKAQYFSWLLLALMGVSAGLRADVVDVANALRARGCGANLQPLKSHRALDRAAKAFARGASPQAAAVDAGYQSTQLTSIRLTGFDQDAEYRRILGDKYCAALGDRALQDIGVARRGDQTWILLGAERKAPENAKDTARRVLQEVNEARAQPRRCGKQSFTAAPPLAYNPVLEKAALAHARDMAKYSFMEHEGRDGSTPAERVTRAGYKWSSVGENVAAGPQTAEEVVAGWLASPGHCSNIMSAKFSEMGVAFALNKKDDYGVYWAQNFAAPRK